MTELHAARGDCERIGGPLVGQPVNTMSSLAYVGAAWWLRSRRSDDRGGRVLVVPLAATAAGLGSIAYHGPGTPLARAVHDVTALALALTTALDLTVAPTRPGRRRIAVGAATMGAAAAVHAASRSGRPWCRPESRLQGHALWHVLSALAVAIVADPTARRPLSSGG